MTKYGAKKVTYKDIQFDSKMEADYYRELLRLQIKGEVADIELQPKYELQPKFTKQGKKYLPIRYIADFLVTYPDGTKKVIDVKGMETTDFKLKAKMFHYNYPDLELVLITESKIDGGWITLEDLKKARKERKKLREAKKK